MEILKQLLSGFSLGLLQGVILSGGLISAAYGVFWILLKKRLRNWKIQTQDRVDTSQIKTELKNSLLVLIVGALFSSIVIYLASKGYTKIYTDLSGRNAIGSFLASFLVLLIIEDTWFYWSHRLLHHKAIYKYIHVVHHKSIDVNPFTSMSFQWIEPTILTLWIFPVAFLVPIYAPALALVQIYGLLDNIKSHLGYELYPGSFNKSWLRFLTSSTFHNMHHAKFNGNYGVHFRIWDKIMGTEFKDYKREYDAVQERKQI